MIRNSALSENEHIENSDVANCDSPRLRDDYESEFEGSVGNESTSIIVASSDKGHSRNENASNIVGTFEPRTNIENRRLKPTIPYNRYRNVKKPTQPALPMIERWENTRVALSDAQSQNALLRKQLQECRLELRTVQRQYKLQSVRLNRVIGQEADFPQIIDRLTAELRSVKTQLREKTTQCETCQRKLFEMQRRLAVLERESTERREAMNSAAKQTSNIVSDQLEKEHSRVVTLQRQLDLVNKTHKHRMNMANEQIRKLRDAHSKLQETLVERTKVLQEKIKLLELQNIYSQRIPKKIAVQVPSTDYIDPATYKIRKSAVSDKPPAQMATDRLKQAAETSVSERSEALKSMEPVSREVAEGESMKASFGEQISSERELAELDENITLDIPNMEKRRSDETLEQTYTSLDISNIQSESTEHPLATDVSVAEKESPTNEPSNEEKIEESDSLKSQPLKQSRQNVTCEYTGDEPGQKTEVGGQVGCPSKEIPTNDLSLAMESERALKDRLLKKLNSMTHMEEHPKPKTPSAIPVKIRQISDDARKIKSEQQEEKSREVELWNELFGSNEHKSPSTRVSSHERTHSPERSKIPTKMNFGEYIPSSPKLKTSPRGRSSPSLLPRLVEPRAKVAEGMHPKYNKRIYFKDEDSDVEELQL